MNKHEIFLLHSEIEMRRRAAQIRSEYLREVFGDLGRRIRAALSGRKMRKNGHKMGNRVGGAAA